MGTTSEPKKELCPTKKRSKRKVKVVEEIRRQKDGRAAMVAVSKMRSAMKVFSQEKANRQLQKKLDTCYKVQQSKFSIYCDFLPVVMHVCVL